MEPEGWTREDPAKKGPWRMARAGPEGQTRPALARQEARGEPAAWQSARVGPARQEAWKAPAGRGAWEAPVRRGAWAAPAERGAWAASAQRGAGAAQGRPPGRQRALERPPGLSLTNSSLPCSDCCFILS